MNLKPVAVLALLMTVGCAATTADRCADAETELETAETVAADLAAQVETMKGRKPRRPLSMVDDLEQLATEIAKAEQIAERSSVARQYEPHDPPQSRVNQARDEARTSVEEAHQQRVQPAQQAYLDQIAEIDSSALVAAAAEAALQVEIAKARQAAVCAT